MTWGEVVFLKPSPVYKDKTVGTQPGGSSLEKRELAIPEVFSSNMQQVHALRVLKDVRGGVGNPPGVSEENRLSAKSGSPPCRP